MMVRPFLPGLQGAEHVTRAVCLMNFDFEQALMRAVNFCACA